MARLIRTVQQETELLRQQVFQSGLAGQHLQQQAALKSQQDTLQRRAEHEWNQIKDIFKALGWILDRTAGADDEYDDYDE